MVFFLWVIGFVIVASLLMKLLPKKRTDSLLIAVVGRRGRGKS